MRDKTIKDATAKLLEINKVVSQLDPAIRAASFEILSPLYFDDVRKPAGAAKPSKTSSAAAREDHTDDKAAFFGQHDHDKPKDNVMLIAAWLYSQHGKFPITRADVQAEADYTGLTVPDRSDNTMRYMKYKGKNLFRPRSKGFELTVHGEKRIREAYDVTKGNRPRPVQDEQ